ncbi:MAG: ABC transporter ATP-binding protein [Gammaproteobacteria bacterium]|nr:ABC transporter ATP-binding protein [Gammaproteobacteria bacterium]
MQEPLPQSASGQPASTGPAKVFIDVRNLSKKYGSKTALSDVSLSIGEGEIVGLIGPNGAGKSTLLKAIMGLIKYSGKLEIFGKDPFRNRTGLLRNMSYIADVASLPAWMKVNDLLEFVSKTHPKFDINRARTLLKDSPIGLEDKIGGLSKGMKTRLHLAIILAVNTALLVLDEPTLGLDVLVRRDFQDLLVKDYYNNQRSIFITTHQIDEVESILTRVIFIKEGRITLDFKVADLKTRYCKLVTNKNVVFADENLRPIYERSLPEHTELIFQDVDRQALSEYGKVITPSLEDLFVAINS